MRRLFIALLICGTLFAQQKDEKKKEKPPSPLDKYIKEASVPQESNGQVPANGSLWSPAARFSAMFGRQHDRVHCPFISRTVPNSPRKPETPPARGDLHA